MIVLLHAEHGKLIEKMLSITMERQLFLLKTFLIESEQLREYDYYHPIIATPSVSPSSPSVSEHQHHHHHDHHRAIITFVST
jgi:hypothetical protein